VLLFLYYCITCTLLNGNDGYLCFDEFTSGEAIVFKSVLLDGLLIMAFNISKKEASYIPTFKGYEVEMTMS
jgi:hypothetical protein